MGWTPQNSRAVEPTWEYSVQVSANVQTAPPRITLQWPQDTIAVGREGETVLGMNFVLHGGRAAFDYGGASRR